MIQAANVVVMKVSLTILCIGGHAAVRHCAAAVFLSTLLSPNLYLHFYSERLIYIGRSRGGRGGPELSPMVAPSIIRKYTLRFEQFYATRNSFVCQ